MKNISNSIKRLTQSLGMVALLAAFCTLGMTAQAVPAVNYSLTEDGGGCGSEKKGCGAGKEKKGCGGAGITDGEGSCGSKKSCGGKKKEGGGTE